MDDDADDSLAVANSTDPVGQLKAIHDQHQEAVREGDTKAARFFKQAAVAHVAHYRSKLRQMQGMQAVHQTRLTAAANAPIKGA